MNYEEVIDELTQMYSLSKNARRHNEAIEKAIESVKLQIPQKPEKLKVTENLSYLICPVCRKSEVAITHRCPCCGQAIDWSDYDMERNDMTVFAKRILTLKKERNMKFSDMGELTGINASNFSQWTRKYQLPNADFIIIIAKAFDVSADWLLGLSEERKRR